MVGSVPLTSERERAAMVLLPVVAVVNRSAAVRTTWRPTQNALLPGWIKHQLDR